MTQPELLLNIKNIYPRVKIVLRFEDGGQEALIRVNRHDPFEDGLNPVHPYRIVLPATNTITSAGNTDEAISLLEDAGFSSSSIDLGLDETLMDMLMIMDAKQEMIEEKFSEDTISRAKTKHAAIDAQFHAVKNDPQKLLEFMTRLAQGDDVQPALSIVPEGTDTDD